MNKNILVSVIIPTYNAEKYIKEALDSIIEQTYKNLEIIIVDDCSTDKTYSILNSYKKKDPRIQLYRNYKNKRISFTLNHALRYSKGKYVVRMDADDISLPSRIEEQVQFMEKHEHIGVSGTYAETFGDNVDSYIMKYPVHHDDMKVRLLFSVCFNHPTVIIRRKILTQNNLEYNIKYTNSQDYELWTRLIDLTKVANLPKVLLKYRIVKTSITRNTDDSLRYELLNGVFSKYLKKLKINNTDELNKIHFIIGSNSRLSSNKINLNVVDNYFDQIIKQNKKIKIFNDDNLQKFLSRKYMITAYYQIKHNYFNIFKFIKSKYFFKFIKYYFLRIISEK